LRKRARLSHGAGSQFAAGQTVRTVVEGLLWDASAVPTDEWPAAWAETLGRAGFESFEVAAESLSGGWRKRSPFAEGVVQQPEISWCSMNLLITSTWPASNGWSSFSNPRPSPPLMVSHDRYFLENVATAMVELTAPIRTACWRVTGNTAASGRKRGVPARSGQTPGRV